MSHGQVFELPSAMGSGQAMEQFKQESDMNWYVILKEPFGSSENEESRYKRRDQETSL